MTIGAFARATGLSAKTLRSYDRLGLLSPARVDPDTRYRLYSREQVERGLAIRYLRELEVPLRLRKVDPEERGARVRELLRLVDLADRMNHRPQELSGGEQQRVAIARALGNEPRLLVADEPTGQLDSHRAQMVMTLLRRLVHERDVLAIVATHDPLMMELADHLVELRDGEVVGEEEATHVSAAPHAG